MLEEYDSSVGQFRIVPFHSYTSPADLHSPFRFPPRIGQGSNVEATRTTKVNNFISLALTIENLRVFNAEPAPSESVLPSVVSLTALKSNPLAISENVQIAHPAQFPTLSRSLPDNPPMESVEPTSTVPPSEEEEEDIFPVRLSNNEELAELVC